MLNVPSVPPIRGVVGRRLIRKVLRGIIETLRERERERVDRKTYRTW